MGYMDTSGLLAWYYWVAGGAFVAVQFVPGVDVAVDVGAGLAGGTVPLARWVAGISGAG